MQRRTEKCIKKQAYYNSKRGPDIMDATTLNNVSGHLMLSAF